MGLKEYRRKRNFQVTAEPRGGRSTTHKALQFVIQKHAASHLHYDFRLELEGVLKSWAIPKGPSLDPQIKRLAMHVEDHPLEYGDFEGIIPAGQYGGGTVMLWDRGTWEPVGDARAGYREGKLKLVLHGEKLHGGWMLVRKGGSRGDRAEKSWFLFKERDKFSSPETDITTQKPLSVTTGRDLDEITSQATRVWGKGGEVSNEKRRSSRSSTSSNGHISQKRAKSPAAKSRGQRYRLSAKSATSLKRLIKSPGAKKASILRAPDVELATLAKEPPDGDEWLHEIKFDGYRMLCRIEAGRARFISRNGRDWSAKFPDLVQCLGSLPVKSAILDGEVVVMQPDGTTSFQALQNAFQAKGSKPFLFFAFDLLYLNGYDTRLMAIEARKELLRLVLPRAEKIPVRFSEHVIGNGAVYFAEATRLQLEGIVSKRMGQPYIGERTRDWLKIKAALREEFVIGGFTRPSGSRHGFGALALGYLDEHNRLQYVGRVGTGFDDKTLTLLHDKLRKLAQKKSPFANLFGSTGQARGVTWVEPRLVAQVEFSQWTIDRQLRHPSFQGLREDKPARDVVRDEPISPPVIDSAAKSNGKVKEAHASRHKPNAARLHKVSADNGRASAGGAAEKDEIAGVRISHPDKLLYPEDGITKRDLAEYYQHVAQWMLPHVEERLLSLFRCPDGSGGKCFFQKHPGEGTSEHFRRFKVREKQKLEEYLALYDLAGLISLVQMGVLEIHLWGSRADEFEKPDRLIFDLDPDPLVKWPQVVAAARELRLLLEELELSSFIKTTGGKGLHIVVPIRRRQKWPEAKAFCRAVADFMVAAAPDRYIATMSKSARKGKIFVDYLRNDRGATAIAPYSTRARAGAPVSVPITWEELSDDLLSTHFTVQNIGARLSHLRKDPWIGINKVKQSITAAMVRKLQITRREV